MEQHATAALVGIGVLGLLAQWLAWRIRLPAILPLLAVGLLVGPVVGWLHPDALFGELLFPIISLAVAVVLFEGGLTLRLHEIRGLGGPVRRLLTVGLLLTLAGTTLAAWLFVGLSTKLALLFGAVTVVTGPTVIVPLLRTVRPVKAVANVLRWEGIVIDPIGALMAVLVFEFLVSTGGSHDLGGVLATFGLVIAVGIGIGAASGYLLGLLLRNYWLPDYLHNVGTLVLVMAVFHASNQVFAESGLLAVTVMGIWLANMKRVPVEDIADFKESLSVLLISGLFILLAARLEPDSLAMVGWGAVALLAAMQFVVRPVSVLASTLGTALTWRERALLAWIAPRGIVAAAVSAIFAVRLEQAGFPGAELLVPLTFIVILFTVTLQSITALPLASILQVREPPPRGILVVGANPVGRAIGEALQRLDIPVLLADPNRKNVKAAQMQGLPCFYGDPTSEHAERHMDRAGLGLLFAVSPRTDLNTLASLYFAKEFGENKVYRLPPGEKDQRLPMEMRRRHRRDDTLFGADVTYAKLASLISQGASIHATDLTPKFGWSDYEIVHAQGFIPLFALDPGGRVHVYGGVEAVEPAAGWTVASLILPAEEQS